MLRKRRPAGYLIDKLHKGFVLSCIGVTLYGLGVAGHRAYLYFTVTRPARAEEQLRQLQLEALKKEELKS